MATKDNFQNDLTGKIVGFLNEIGLSTIPAKLDGQTFLPGILVKEGKLYFDKEKLAFPGDLLHEAGHLAVAPAALREKLSDEVIVPDADLDGLETQSIAWTYAACVHLRFDPRIVFHESGYHGKSESLLFNFSLGIFIGLNGLEESEMAFSEIKARELGVSPFPVMQKWLRD